MEAARIEPEQIEPAPEQPEEPALETGTDEATRRLQTTSPLPAGATDGVTESSASEPETGEPEAEPSDAQAEAEGREETSSRREAPFAPAEDSGAADEVDREEPMPAGEGQTPDEFFDKGREEPPEEREEEGRIFRASRFLRRRA